MPELLLRSNRALKERLFGEDAKFESWDNKSVQQRLSWGGGGGDIARLGRTDPTRFTFRASSHRNYGHIIRHVADHKRANNCIVDIYMFGDGSITCISLSTRIGIVLRTIGISGREQ